MKTMRYLLITFVVVMVSMAVYAKAQNLAEPPRADFHSTSSMVGSGSTLPQAVHEGAFTTYDAELGTRANKPGIRRDEGRPGDWTDPYKDPIGEGMWAMLALAAVYAVFRIRRKCV